MHFSFGDSLCEGMLQTPYVWIPTRQPIVLREWRPLDTRRDVITTVMSWTSYKPLTHLGVTYGQKDAEFMKFLGLPSRMQTTPLEIALGNTEHVNWSTATAELTPSLQKILHDKPQLSATDLLQLTGWRVVDAYDRCGSLDSYRDYIRTSKAEWSVAKNGYVRGSAGWFSCRSACYLACGRPVVVQNTGFDRTLPVGEGLLTFRTVEEAAASLLEVLGNYARHCATAAQIASNYFESGKVLADLLELSYSSASSPTFIKGFGASRREGGLMRPLRDLSGRPYPPASAYPKDGGHVLERMYFGDLPIPRVERKRGRSPRQWSVLSPGSASINHSSLMTRCVEFFFDPTFERW